MTGAQGVGLFNRQVLSEMFKNAPWTLNDFELKDAEVRQVRDDVAILAYKVHEDHAADTSTWVQRDGRWRCALHTEAIVGDPFGRDRRTGA